MLALVVAVGIAGGGNWRLSWVMVLLTFAAGVFVAEQPVSAGLRWIGLTLLVLSAGPVVVNPVAMAMRSAAWRASTSGITALTGIFTFWYLVRLPSFGIGFSSFMYQCMLLGPIAGMGVVIALARAMHGHSWRWGLLSILGLLPLLASGSRVAVIAALAASCFLLIRRRPILGLGALVLCSALVYGFLSRGRALDASGDSLTGAITRKGDLNSRADLWQARITEFKSSPVFGIGVGMGSDEKTWIDQHGDKHVEPGSSYLALLSMTGGLGSVAFFLAMSVLLIRLIVFRQNDRLEKDTLNVVGIYLAVHAFAEGWVLGFGNALCFLFWLWLGRVGDLSAQPSGDKAQRRLRVHQQFQLQARALAIKS